MFFENPYETTTPIYKIIKYTVLYMYIIQNFIKFGKTGKFFPRDVFGAKMYQIVFIFIIEIQLFESKYSNQNKIRFIFAPNNSSLAENCSKTALKLASKIPLSND